MRIRKPLSFVLLTIGCLAGSSSGQERKQTDAGDGTSRTLASIVGSMQYATLQEGFVVRLFSEREATLVQKETAEHNQRREQYKARRSLIDERIKEIDPRLPWLVSYCDMLFKRLDKSGDGVLDQKEATKYLLVEAFADADDNSDGQVGESEFLRSILIHRSGKVPGPSIRLFPPNEAAESVKLVGTLRQLDRQYAAVQRRRPTHIYYRIMEASSDFLRLRSDDEERIIPYTSIREFRRAVQATK